MLRDKRFWIGCAISIAVMALFTRGLDWRQLGASLARAHWGWILPALFLYIVSYWSRARRITLILAPLKAIPTSRSLPPLLIGFMCNNLLPARLGELVFAYLLGQREGLSRSSALAGVLLSRILDGFSILLFFLAGLLSLLDAQDSALIFKVKLVGYSAAGVFGLALTLFFCLVALRAPTLRLLASCLRMLPPRWSAKILQWIESFVSGLAILSQPGPLFRVFAENLLPWTLELGVYYCTARAFGLGLGLAQCSLVMGMCNLAMLLPSVPGGLGLFEAGGLMVMGLWGPAGTAGPLWQATSLGFLLVTHAVILLPVNIGGAYCLWVEGISISGTLKELGRTKI